MSPQGFLSKVNAAKSAAGFIAQYREYMTTGKLAPILSPIVAKVDDGQLDAEGGIKDIANMVMTHIIASDMLKLEQAAESGAQRGTQKNWLATIYTATGDIAIKINSKGEEEELVKAFDKSADGDRWVDNRLYNDGEPGWYGVVEFTKATNVRSVIMRDDSLSRIMRKKKGPVIHQKAVSTKSLGFGVHAKTSGVTFSKG